MTFIALIAGEGRMAPLIIDGIHASGKRVLLLAVEGVTSKELVQKADETVWVAITQLGKAMKACQRHQVKEITMAGRVPHSSIFSLSLLKMDWTTIKVWLTMPDRRADSILSAIGKAFSKVGVTLISSVRYLQHLLAPKGLLTDQSPSKAVMEEIHFGQSIAKEMGRLDIGQTVVVKGKSVVAVEAMEGTDQCIERAGQLAGEGCVVVKMAKPHQDMRFDVPTIGINTIEKLAKIKASALAIESGKTLLIDEGIKEKAKALGIAIVSL